eukprot:TRINITY_DN4542_c0_g1_i1.p2 TRINITY_DN4542_c0_g1~~TRINITY_DN4542_c0_g1_i1.p2  ORF type:complete len:243 (+),score=21.07 TRINITY_DN4542_c0_g1_i1:1-729(+)
METHCISPSLIPGWLHNSNKGAIDWSWQNLLAFGSQAYIVIIDPATLRIVQTLDEHRAHVTRVAWASQSSEDDPESPDLLTLASGDMQGNIIIWNVIDAAILTTLHDEQHSMICDLQWHSFNNFILALYAPSVLILWDTKLGVPLWRKDFTESMVSCKFSPFDYDSICCASDKGAIYFGNDVLSTNLGPPSIVSKYNVGPGSLDTLNDDTPRSNSNEFVQFVFSPYSPHIMYFLLSREIIFF